MNIGDVLSAAAAAWRAFYAARTAPQLRLDLPAPHGQPTRRSLDIVANGDRWQVVFTLRLLNNGKRVARHWRVRFITDDADTMMHVDRGHDARAITTGTLVGPGWEYVVEAAGASDIVSSRPVPIVGRHTLNFRDKPDAVMVKCWLTADDMADHERTLRLELYWTRMTARFRWNDQFAR